MQQTRDSSHSIARLDQRRRAIEAEIKALELEVTKRLKEKQQLQDDRQDDVAERERLQVSLRGIEQAMAQDSTTADDDRRALAAVEKEIAVKDAQLKTVAIPAHDKLQKDEAELKDKYVCCVVARARACARRRGGGDRTRATERRPRVAGCALGGRADSPRPRPNWRLCTRGRTARTASAPKRSGTRSSRARLPRSKRP